MEVLQADYVIVGAGSAGCVLANRLSADPDTRVVLLEAGNDDRPTKAPSQAYLNMMIHMVAGFIETRMHPKTSWNYNTEPDPMTRNRIHAWPRGKTLGGSSSINGMLYVRGQHADYDHWRQMGCEGWSWDDVRPYFSRLEDHERGACDWHSAGGPLHISDVREKNPVGDAVIAACEQVGIAHNSDYNGATQEGVGYFQNSMKNGRRCSSATAYLHPAMRRRNLTVVTKALATKVIFENKRAVGVEYLRAGVKIQVRAKREVILSGGAVNSPQLLQLSGVGPGDVLQRHGIEVVADLPGVGENLQDHVMLLTTYRLKPGSYSLNERSHGTRFWREVLKYGVKREGLLAQSVAQLTAFCRSRPDLSNPDLQIHFMAATMDMEAFRRTHRMKLERAPGLTISPCQLRPESRGSIHIQSPDPTVHPAIRANYLSDPIDQEAAVASLRLTREISQQAALRRWIDSETMPGIECATDEQLWDYAQAMGASGYHPVGTCAMGIGDRAVLDPQLRVRGVEGLRVVDASAMPRIISGNTNGPTIMIGERAADLILGKQAA